MFMFVNRLSINQLDDGSGARFLDLGHKNASRFALKVAFFFFLITDIPKIQICINKHIK